MTRVRSVLIVVQNLPVPFDRRVWLEATALSEEGYRVSVICPKGKDGSFQAGHEVIDGVHIYRYGAPLEAESVPGFILEFAYCWIMTAMLSLRIWMTRGFDVIHACNPPETYFLLAWFYRLSGKKFVFDHHDLSPEMYLAKGGKREGLLFRCLLLLERLTFKTADVVITTNQSHKKIAQVRGGVEEDDIFVVRSGPDFGRLKRVDPDPSIKNGFRYLVCYLGEMCPQDGVDIVLKAAQVIITDLKRRDTKFVLVGGGSALAGLRRLNAEMKLEPFVEFTGRVSDAELCRYLSTSDLCVDPDPYTEWSDQSTMNKIMEYMMFGKPIVAFDLKENRYSAGGSAAYAKPNDVGEFAGLISQLLDNEGKRREMGAAAVRRVESELSWDHSRPHLLAAYRKLFEC